MSMFTDGLQHAWSMFNRNDTTSLTETQPVFQLSNEPRALNPNNAIPTRTYARASISSMIFNRIAMDASMVKFQHVKLAEDKENQTVQYGSSLQRLFEVEMNIDQSATDFFHDLVYSLFDEGVVAAVPVEATLDPSQSDAYDIKSMRVGKILEWFPTKVRVKIYNESKGDFSEVVVPKKMCAIIENPLANILGTDNPTMNRLIQKLSILDKQDIDSVANKWNMILQLPVPVRNDIKRKEADERVKDIEKQLQDSNLGIAYITADEKITQLNRQINSNLMDEIKYLTDELLSQIGLTKAVFDGTANAEQMQNYYTRTIDPIVTRIQEEFQRKFITKTGYTQGHRIITYSDPFKLVPTSQLATIGDALLRNRILTSNEFRAVIGYGPIADPMADQLYNPNISDARQDVSIPGSVGSPEVQDEYAQYPQYEEYSEEDIQNGGK
nr:MAG TPA: portal protein [Caudoviricetes sp.]DAR94800.1 MAG TPA: portal protein [Caudoviricetes sp.]